jgi:hypothetical protein
MKNWSQRDIFASTAGSAEFSECGRYRYTLHRSWGGGGRVCFVMLNPSTADADVNDPTVARCVGHARRWGYGGLVVVNIFALRSTNPVELYHTSDIGDDHINDSAIIRAASGSDLVVCAWGAHGGWRNRGKKVALLLTSHGVPMHHFGLTQRGHPKHPLYLPNASRIYPLTAGAVGRIPRT